jgi:hypothetical protein
MNIPIATKEERISRYVDISEENSMIEVVGDAPWRRISIALVRITVTRLLGSRKMLCPKNTTITNTISVALICYSFHIR